MPDDTNDKLTNTKPLTVHKVGLAAKLANAKNNPAAISIFLEPAKATHRISLVIDNSGSMATKWDDKRSRMAVTKEACEGFLHSCNSKDTSIAYKTMDESKREDKPFSSDYLSIIYSIRQLEANHGTPLFTRLGDTLNEELKPTRVVVMSDGAPMDGGDGGSWDEPPDSRMISRKDRVLNKAISLKIPCDAVFIGDKDDRDAIKIMKEIAQKTGGNFIHFKDANSFRDNFKYLSPAYYGLLADPTTKAQIEGK